MGPARRDVIVASAGLLLLGAAIALPHLHDGSVQPAIGESGTADAAPIFGWWNVHVGWGTPPAILIGAAAIGWGSRVAQRLSSRALTVATWVTAAAWAFSLSMVDGWQRGFASRLTDPNEYLHQGPTVTDVGAAVRGFTGTAAPEESRST